MGLNRSGEPVTYRSGYRVFGERARPLEGRAW